MMDKETEKELNRVNKRIDEVEEEQKEQRGLLATVMRDIRRFWHLGLGIGVGLILKEVGLEKLLGKFL